MDNKKKMCFLIPSVKSGGIETYLLRFLRFLDENIDVTVLVRNRYKGELYEDYKNTGATIHFQPLGYFNLKSINWYYRFFKQQKFDTICDFNANFAGIPMILANVVGVKKRITFYRQSSHHFNRTAFTLLYTNFMNRLVYWNSTAIFSNSEAAFQFFFKNEYIKGNRFKVIKNGVNIKEYLDLENISKLKIREKLQLPSNKFIIGHTGRFTEAKNHHFLIDVVSKLIKEDNNFFLVLIGNDTVQLLPYINQLNISANVKVLGYQNNIPEYLRAFDLFFFPSITEGQPNALIEAMVSGLPIVASNIPSIKECLPSESWDCLVDPKDIENAVNKIKKNRQIAKDNFLQRHAILNFNADIQFKYFFDSLK